jgi:hypothetical protein
VRGDRTGGASGVARIGYGEEAEGYKYIYTPGAGSGGASARRGDLSGDPMGG